MAKKRKNKKIDPATPLPKPGTGVSERVEEIFKISLKIMSWIVGLSFTAIIILPNFTFPYIDIVVKVIFYLGILNLLLFALLEMFGTSLKQLLSKLF